MSLSFLCGSFLWCMLNLFNLYAKVYFTNFGKLSNIISSNLFFFFLLFSFSFLNSDCLFAFFIVSHWFLRFYYFLFNCFSLCFLFLLSHFYGFIFNLTDFILPSHTFFELTHWPLIYFSWSLLVLRLSSQKFVWGEGCFRYCSCFFSFKPGWA